MFFKSDSRPLALMPVIFALTLSPAFAQDQRAKDGWDMLRNSLAEAGLRVASEGIDETASGLVVSGVTIRPQRGGSVLHLPTLGVEPRGPDGYAFIPSSGARLDLPDTGALELDFDGHVLFDRQPDGLRLAPDFTRIEARHEGPAGYGEDDVTTVRVLLEDIAGSIATVEGAQVNLTGDLRLGLVAYDQRWDNDASRLETAEIDDLGLRFSVDALNALSASPDTVAALFNQGFALQLAYEAAASRSSSRQMLDGAPLNFDSVGGYSDSILTVRDGRLEAQGSGVDMQFSGMMGDSEAQFTADQMAAGFGLPLIVTEDMQDFGLSLSIDGMQASEESWMLLGARTFADDTADVALAVTGEGRWLVDPSRAEDSESPVDLAAIRLDRLSLRLGQANFEGAGRFDTDRDAATLEQAMNGGQGAFTFTLRGGEALLTRLSNEGVLPTDQAFLVRMMLGGLARQIAEDHLESEVTIMPGGQVLVNGMPLPF